MDKELQRLYDEALSDNEYSIVWHEAERYVVESVEDLVEQVKRRQEFKERVSKMKTYADYLGCNSKYKMSNTL